MKYIKFNKDAEVSLNLPGFSEVNQTIKRGAIGVLDENTQHYTFKHADVTNAVSGNLPEFGKAYLFSKFKCFFDIVEEAGTVVTPVAMDGGAKPSLTRIDLTSEAWREYSWTEPNGREHMKRFDDPEAVYVYKGCSTHRVITKRDGQEVVTIVPSMGTMDAP